MSEAISKSAKRRQRTKTKTDKILQQIETLKTSNHVANLNPLQVKTSIENKDEKSESLLRVIAGIDSVTKNNIQRMRESAGLKMLDNWSQKVMDKHYSQLSPSEKKRFLEYVLVDDLGQVATQVLKYASPLVSNYIWSRLKDTPFIHKARGVLRDYFGIDLNDDVPLGANRFTIQPHQTQWARPADVGYRYDAVCTQAIASMLFPEYTSCRIPSDVALKTGMLNKTQTFTLPTNATGSAAVVFYPQYFDTSTFYRIYNDATFNPSTGTQSPASAGSAGPLSGLSGTIQTVRLTAFSVMIEPIVSTLNNAGRIIYNMNDFSTTSPSAVALPFNTTTCRDAQYCVYGSVAGSSGHRLVYDNSSVSDESFTNFGAVRDYDAIQILIEGAQPSSTILQISYTYQLEYTISGGSSILIEKQPPPLGPATIKAYDAAISMRPDLRIIGRQESAELYSKLVDTPPYYSDILKLLNGHQFKHNYSEVLMSRGVGSDQEAGADFDGLSSVSDGYSLATS